MNHWFVAPPEGKPASEIPWGRKIEKPGVMDLITVDDAIERYEAAAHEMGQL